ncbi:MAG: transposase [Chloroflexota bacterium]|nr:transposase [Chloroflexota bacterium]
MTLLDRLGTDLPRRYYLSVDVGYKEHVAVVIPLETFVRGDGRWKRATCVHFPSTQAGLRTLQGYLDGFSTDASEFFGLCEPTGGYYGASVFQYLLNQGYDMNLVENAMTRNVREKIFPGTPKTDEMETRVMARIGYLHEAVGEEFTLRPLELSNADDADLLALCRDSWKLSGMITRARNQFTQLMAVTFPELKTFFTSSVSTVGPVSLIAAYPTPGLLAEAPEEEVGQVLWQARCYHHARRVGELQRLARASSGLLPNPGRAWRLKWLTDFLLTNFQHQKALDTQIEDLVEQRDDYQLIVNVPYAGSATLGVILAVTGDVDRFSNYRKYVAYSGYFPGLEKSQTIDRTKMSRRGNRDLKRALFQIAAPLVWFDQGSNAYKDLFQRKMAEGREWYQAMPFVCAALARHIYHCLKFSDPYDVERAFGGSPFNPALDEEPLDLTTDLDETFEVMEASLDETGG